MLGNNLVQFNVYAEYSTEDILTSTTNIQTHNQSERSDQLVERVKTFQMTRLENVTWRTVLWVTFFLLVLFNNSGR